MQKLFGLSDIAKIIQWPETAQKLPVGHDAEQRRAHLKAAVPLRRGRAGEFWLP